MKLTIIGISDSSNQWFPPEVQGTISNGHVFSGGKRHHELVMHLLPANHEWIDITVPLAGVFDEYRRHDDIVVFASGDPLFYGFANTVMRELPDAHLTVFPSFNSLQMLAHRLLMPYHDMTVVSLTGRAWHELDRALIEGREKIGVLTDGTHTPAAIARRMLEYGFTDYKMHVGERLGNVGHERILILSLAEASEYDAAMPNCLILQGRHVRRTGIPDNEFELLDGRERMITKMPIRLMSLHAMHLEHRHTLWDIGSCTGSISIEAKLMYPHLHITAFEKRSEGRQLMDVNTRRFCAPGIELHIGDFMQSPHLNQPSGGILEGRILDAVFIGGHGGNLEKIMEQVVKVLAPGGCICMNSVTPDSRQQFIKTCMQLNLEMEPPLHIVLNDYNPIDILVCTKQQS